MEKFIIRRGGYDNIDMIKPLWERLNKYHYFISPHFKKKYEKIDWVKRKSNIINNSKEILFEYAVDTDKQKIAGYCISTIDLHSENSGEIDSLFIEEEYRNSGLGKQFMENALDFMNLKKVDSVRLIVGSGNESVLNFYERFDFYPSFVVLQRNEND